MADMLFLAFVCKRKYTSCKIYKVALVAVRAAVKIGFNFSLLQITIIQSGHPELLQLLECVDLAIPLERHPSY